MFPPIEKESFECDLLRCSGTITVSHKLHCSIASWGRRLLFFADGVYRTHSSWRPRQLPPFYWQIDPILLHCCPLV